MNRQDEFYYLESDDELLLGNDDTEFHGAQFDEDRDSDDEERDAPKKSKKAKQNVEPPDCNYLSLN